MLFYVNWIFSTINVIVQENENKSFDINYNII
jgi:hypothetical protein